MPLAGPSVRFSRLVARHGQTGRERPLAPHASDKGCMADLEAVCYVVPVSSMNNSGRLARSAVRVASTAASTVRAVSGV